MTLALEMVDNLSTIRRMEEPELGIKILLNDGSEVILTFTPEGPITITSGCPGDIYSAATNYVKQIKDSNLVSPDQGREGVALFIILFNDDSILGLQFEPRGIIVKTGYALSISPDMPLTSH